MARRNFHEYDFPLKGVSDYFSFEKQSSMTTPRATNVRGHDPATGRYRGAQRKGIVKFVEDRIGTTSVQDINHIIRSTAITASNTLSTRTINGVAVSEGILTHFDSTKATVIPGSILSATPPVIFSTLHF